MKGTLKVIFVGIIGISLLMSVSCAKQAKRTGFLSDYSRLERTNGSLRYLDMQRLGKYSKFIIEKIHVHLYGTPREKRPDAETQMELTSYMHDALIKAISDRYMVVSQPGPGIARLKVAITDIEKSTPALNVLPQTKITGLGIGGASMEGELLDSQTGEQIGALVESQKGKTISLSGLKKWGDARAVMDDWAKRFRNRLDEAQAMK